MKRVLITGGAGFVAKCLAKYLQSINYEIFVTKLKEEKNITYVSHKNIFDMDILNKYDIQSILRQVEPDYIFHLAAQSSAAISWENPDKTIEINVIGTIRLLETVRRERISPRLLIVGSGEEYGTGNEFNNPFNEKDKLNPANPYAVSKAAQNMMGSLYYKAYGLDIVFSRAFNHIGPEQSEKFVVADFCKQIALIENNLQEPIILVGNLEIERDFTDVRDIVKGYHAIIEKGISGTTYNIGSGKSVSIRKILDKLISLSNKKVQVHVDPNKIRPFDVLKIEADISKVIADTGWSPKISLEDTLKDTLEFWRNKVKELNS